MAVRIDCGESDPFAPAVKALRDRLPDPGVVHLAKGCHDNAFWRSVAPAQLRLSARPHPPLIGHKLESSAARTRTWNTSAPK